VPRIILLLAIIIALALLVRRIQAMPPHKRRSGYVQLILGAAALAAIVLTAMGKMHWVGAALTGLLVAARQTLPILVRVFPYLQKWSRQTSAPDGQHSEVKTELLRMTLDHSNGELQGEVLAGPFIDWTLDEMNREQLQALLTYCQEHDADSEQLLMSYLEQRFPNGWQHEGESENNQQTSSSAIGRSEALAVLGLSEDATRDEIVAAHRSLIQKIHPDRGGNDYLAAKINEAKDFLMKDAPSQ
jgi:hypothetical protein